MKFLILSCLLIISSCGKNSDFVKVDPEVEALRKNCPACLTDSRVTTPGVVTILLALGDRVSGALKISEETARLVAKNSVKFASPLDKPRILVVRDYNHGGESLGDTEYIANDLLIDYETTIFYETSAGLTPDDVAGYDLIWFNNPGYRMGSMISYNTLKNFGGAVILSGDDLTVGREFFMQELTGLKPIDNGSSMTCNGKTYLYDNNGGYSYQIKLSADFLPEVEASLLSFQYGNDIDRSELLGDPSKYQVLATAAGAPGTCEDERPVIVRYKK